MSSISGNVTPAQQVADHLAGTVRLTPKQQARAKRGAILKAQISAAKKELAGIDAEFEAIFQAGRAGTATTAGGKVLARLNVGGQRRLDQQRLKIEEPGIVARFTRFFPSESVGYAPTVASAEIQRKGTAAA